MTDLRMLLGADLAKLAESLSSPVVDVRQVTGLPARSLRRATFRLRCADGSLVKGRRMERVQDAGRVFALARHLDPDGFPRPFARRGRALLEPWIPGHILGAGESDQVLHRCGALLGSVHSVRIELGAEGERWLPPTVAQAFLQATAYAEPEARDYAAIPAWGAFMHVGA